MASAVASFSISTSCIGQCRSYDQSSDRWTARDSVSGQALARLRISNFPARRSGCRSTIIVRAEASEDSSSSVEIAAAVSGAIAVPVVAWSLYTLKTTGCGLPPGPAGSLGAVEGVSYLAILGLVGWSVYTKVKTGSGLPNGPYGALGAVEGMAYLTLLAAIVVFGLQLADFGFIPPPVPGEQCFG